jgi:hypothetical protein
MKRRKKVGEFEVLLLMLVLVLVRAEIDGMPAFQSDPI